MWSRVGKQIQPLRAGATAASIYAERRIRSRDVRKYGNDIGARKSPAAFLIASPSHQKEVAAGQDLMITRLCGFARINRGFQLDMQNGFRNLRGLNSELR